MYSGETLRCDWAFEQPRRTCCEVCCDPLFELVTSTIRANVNPAFIHAANDNFADVFTGIFAFLWYTVVIYAMWQLLLVTHPTIR